jgi:hypothetical protein
MENAPKYGPRSAPRQWPALAEGCLAGEKSLGAALQTMMKYLGTEKIAASFPVFDPVPSMISDGTIPNP